MIVGGVGMGDVATDGGPVSHDRIGYPSRGIEQDRVTVTDEIGVIQLCLASQGTNTQFTIGFLDVVQRGNATDINQDRWPGQAKTQEGNKAVATCQDFGIVAVLIQEGDRPPESERRRCQNPGRWPQPYSPLAFSPRRAIDPD